MGDLSRNFSSREFACRCGCGKDAVDKELILKLQQVRDQFGPLHITSGVRCEAHNRSQGGVPNSAHVLGFAVDIECSISLSRHILVSRLMEAGFKRIGIGKNFVHADLDPGKPKPSLWTY